VGIATHDFSAACEAVSNTLRLMTDDVIEAAGIEMVLACDI
jgi:hypothetical protein